MEKFETNGSGPCSYGPNLESGTTYVLLIDPRTGPVTGAHMPGFFDQATWLRSFVVAVPYQEHALWYGRLLDQLARESVQ